MSIYDYPPSRAVLHGGPVVLSAMSEHYGPALNAAELDESGAEYILSNPRNFPYVAKVRNIHLRFPVSWHILIIHVDADEPCAWSD